MAQSMNCYLWFLKCHLVRGIPLVPLLTEVNFAILELDILPLLNKQQVGNFKLSVHLYVYVNVLGKLSMIISTFNATLAEEMIP